MDNPTVPDVVPQPVVEPQPTVIAQPNGIIDLQCKFPQVQVNKGEPVLFGLLGTMYKSECQIDPMVSFVGFFVIVIALAFLFLKLKK